VFGDVDSRGVEGLRLEVTASDRSERPHLLGVQSQRYFSSSFLGLLVSQSIIITFHKNIGEYIPADMSMYVCTVGSACTQHLRRSDWRDTGTTGIPGACGTTGGGTSSGGRDPSPCSARETCPQRSTTTTRSTRTTSSTWCTSCGLARAPFLRAGTSTPTGPLIHTSI